MNKKIIGLSIAMLFAANGALAQSSSGSKVEFYGILDAAIGTVKYSLSAAPDYGPTVNPYGATNVLVNNSVVGMFNGGMSASRWGVRGSEDLGGGMKAIFDLSSLININTGNLSNALGSLANNRSNTAGTVSSDSSVNGQLFNNVAFLGLSDNVWGKLTFGRHLSAMSDILATYDNVQSAGLFSPIAFSGAYSGGGLTQLKRLDSSIKYTNKMSDFNFGAMYKIGGVAGSMNAQSAFGVWGGYEAKGFGVQAAYQQATDGLSASNSATAGQVTVKNYNATAYMVAGKYAFGKATVRGGFESYTLKQPTDGLMGLGIKSLGGYPISNVPTADKCVSGNSADFCTPARKTNIYWIGGDYNFSEAINLSAGFYNASPRASSDATQKDGNIYYYSMLADYRFTKRTNAYVGMMYAQFKGDQYPTTTTNDNNYVFAVGVRHKF